MNIDITTLNYIKKVVKCASIGKVEGISIEPNLIRGMDDSQTVFLFHTDNIPTFEFGSIGINRLSTFTSRLELMSTDGLTIEANTDKNRNGMQFVRSLNFSSKGMKVDYRCANPAIIRGPKQFVDTITYSIDIPTDAIQYMTKGMAAMSSDEIRLTSSDDGTQFTITDVNGDVFTYTFNDTAKNISDNSIAEFDHTYSLKTLLPLLKAMNNSTCFITQDNGMILITIEGIDLYVFPRTTP